MKSASFIVQAPATAARRAQPLGRVLAMHACPRQCIPVRLRQRSAVPPAIAIGNSRKCDLVPRRLVTAKATGQAARDRPVFQRLADILVVAGLFLAWYGCNIYFNIFNKQVLSVFPQPLTCTWIHLLISSMMALLLWTFKMKKAPVVTPRIIDIIFPLAILHLLGFYTTNASLGKVAVSLTHTIKSMEPFFTVVISWLLMGTRPAKRVVFSLTPVVVGVVVASATDLSFNWAGFIAAMLSNVAFQMRNVLSKKAMSRASFDSLEGGDTADLDEVNIFALMSIGACILMAPLLLLDAPAAFASPGGPTNWMTSDALVKTILAGVCRFGDVLSSFVILQKVTPVTHSVGNCVKRVVVIAASIVFFQTAASSTNIAGTAVALSGVLLYSFAKRSQKTVVDPDQAIRAVQNTAFEDAISKVSPGTLYGKLVRKQEKRRSDDKGDIEYYL